MAPSAKHLPPGPAGLPLVGSFFDVPKANDQPWKWFSSLGQKYGDVITIRILGTNLIVLNSHTAIDEIFDKRREKYSGKAPRKMSELSGLTATLPFMQPNTDFANARKQFHLGIGPSAVHEYDGECEKASLRYIQKLAADPECNDLEKNIDQSIGSLFLRVSTGHEAETDATILTRLNDLAHFAGRALGQDFAILDQVPFLAYAPKWTPFVGPMLTLGAQWKKNLSGLADNTVDLAHDEQASARPSVMGRMLTAGFQADPTDEKWKMIPVTMNAGGMLATESASLTFLLAMLKHPECQRRAQAELDSVLEGKRLPTLADRPRLPYLNAVLSEVLRWVSIAPVVERAVLEDDRYGDYVLPKGARIMANAWAISRDHTLYGDDVEAFRPERFLDAAGKRREDVRDPWTYAFGFGRRMCPGAYLADALLFSHCAHVLTAFDVCAPKDVAMVAVNDKMSIVSNGAACRLEKVYCRLTPRAGTSALLQNGAANGNGVANGRASS